MKRLTLAVLMDAMKQVERLPPPPVVRMATSTSDALPKLEAREVMGVPVFNLHGLPVHKDPTVPHGFLELEQNGKRERFRILPDADAGQPSKT